MEPSVVKPCLKLVGLHIEGFRALRKVDWPADGLGWHGEVPDLVMVGGVNGSGKTTLLEFIAAGAQSLGLGIGMPLEPRTMQARVDLKVASQATGDSIFSVVVGDDAFVERQKIDDGVALSRRIDGYVLPFLGPTWHKTNPILSSKSAFASSDFPSVLYLPTDRRFQIPEEPYKSAGNLSAPQEFFYRFSASDQWKESLEALLYSARWADLNAKEEGHPEKATHFESYAKAFQAFFGESKSLVWEGGELFVKIADTGALHPLMELSSGEKQALILAAELHRRWRPGSLILIDEPELHFHASWQTTLWTMLERLQKERGGQVIVATQSMHLFRIGDPGTKVLLGGGDL